MLGPLVSGLGGKLRDMILALGGLRAQQIMLGVNAILLSIAARRLQRARFAAAVRTVQDLDKDGLDYLLRNWLPPWIMQPNFEKAEHLQHFINLTWPTFNTLICSIIKRVIEDQLGYHGDFGRLTFSRLSFGRQPPHIAGVRGNPVYGQGDMLAMVVDVDVRWAGQPDIVMHLSAIPGATLGLSLVHVAFELRLVLSPIIEELPFLTGISFSLVRRPYFDFDIRLLGGDVMSLPAIGGWLRSAIENAIADRLLWPKQARVRWGPGNDSRRSPGSTAAARADQHHPRKLAPPLGVLLVEVVAAELEPRRSTFLGRLKPVNSRVSLLLPPTETVESEAELVAAQESRSIVQKGLTAVQEGNLKPRWGQSFAFVVSHKHQRLRLLLSHKRSGLLVSEGGVATALGADVPLGSAEIPLSEVLTEAAAAEAIKLQAQLPAAGLSPLEEMLQQAAALAYSTPTKATHHAMPDSPGSSGSDAYLPAEDSFTFISALSSPTPSYASSTATSRRVAGLRDVWEQEVVQASPADPSGQYRNANSQRWIKVVSRSGPSLTHPGQPLARHSGTSAQQQQDEQQPSPAKPSVPAPLGSLPPVGSLDLSAARLMAWQRSEQQRLQRERLRDPHWLKSEGVWLPVPTTDVMTLAGLLAEVAEPSRGDADSPRSMSSDDSSSGWMERLRSYVLGHAFDHERDEEFQPKGPTAGKLHLRLKWRPLLPEQQQQQVQAGGHTEGSSGKPEEKPARAAASAAHGAKPRATPTQRSPSQAASQRQSRDLSLRPGSAADQQQPQQIEQSPPAGLAAAHTAGSSSAADVAQLVEAAAAAAAAASAQIMPEPRLYSGVLAVRVAHTKLEYAAEIVNPVLAVSVALDQQHGGGDPVLLGSSPPRQSGTALPLLPQASAAAAAAAEAVRERLISMQCQAGRRLGLLHWGQMFYLPVLALTEQEVEEGRIIIELGDVASATRLALFGPSLYALDACDSFTSDVQVIASAAIPLSEVLRPGDGRPRDNWRLREATSGVAAADRVELGQVTAQLAYFPLQHCTDDSAVEEA